MKPTRIAVQCDPAAVIVKAGEQRSLFEARELIDAAAARAEQIIGEAQGAYDAERERGFKEGMEAARLEQAEKMIENVGRAIDYFARVERDAIALVMTGVRKIIGDFSDADKVVIVVRGALAAVRNQKQITLRLHPDDAGAVRQRIDEILSYFPAIGFIDVIADGRVGTAACILETDIGLVETSLEGQLIALQQAFQTVLGDRADRPDPSDRSRSDDASVRQVDLLRGE